MDFRERYEEDNAYAVNGDDDVLDADKLLLFRIADGVVEPDQEGDGVVVLSAEGSAVMSVLEGVVVDIYYDINHEWSIVVQHIDGYVSVYHGLHKPLVTVGEKLVAGDVLSTAGSAGRVTFVLWHDGNVVDLSQLL
jgi:murein DD-endopeptidase MepM/ murein hydrolase activator NlpD